MKTYVVRLWDGGETTADHATLRGVVERVADGTSERFMHEDELVAFLRAADPGGPTAPADPTAEGGDRNAIRPGG
ncbi:MAG: hypothetical protein U0R50_16630 [Gaiellales bacterium]